RDPVEPGTQRGLAFERVKVLPCSQHCLLHHVLSFVERPQQAITVQVQFPAIRFDEGDEFRRIAGYDVCLRVFGCHNSSSLDFSDYATARGNWYNRYTA